MCHIIFSPTSMVQNNILNLIKENFAVINAVPDFWLTFLQRFFHWIDGNLWVAQHGQKGSVIARLWKNTVD